jgi:phage shock protein C
MFCTHCGKQIPSGSRFCSACGAACAPAPNPGACPPPFSRLYRAHNDRMVAGVCSGIAQHYGWDVTIVRLILVLCVLFGGCGLLAYVIAWIVIPEAPYAMPQQTAQTPPPPPNQTQTPQSL